MYQYLDYLPVYLRSIKELKALGNCVDQQIKTFQERVNQTNLNGFFPTAETAIIARWENILGLSAPLNASLFARRDAIKAKLMTKPPINLNALKGIIEAYMGLDVDISVADFIVTVKYRGESRIADLDPLYATAYETIPANLLLSISYLYLIWDELDAQNLTFDQLDTKNLTMTDLERGEWIA